MQYFRPGSQLRQLITMLSIVGEFTEYTDTGEKGVKKS